MIDPDWIAVNRANWDESVDIHARHPSYDLSSHRAGRGRLFPIEERELGNVSGLRILHLQCHFGRDSLALAQRGAEVVGLDFSGEAIRLANQLANELNLSDQVRFVQANVYDAANATGQPGGFDLVFVSWGALMWLPDLHEWAKVVTACLRPGGSLYLLEAHPVALGLADGEPTGAWAPRPRLSYFSTGMVTYDDPIGYANPDEPLINKRTHEWRHTLGDVLSAIAQAGLRIGWVREHDAVAWEAFPGLQEGEDGLFRWPGEAWLPLAWSVRALRVT
jgi:SAM-dependent methyltransferase